MTAKHVKAEPTTPTFKGTSQYHSPSTKRRVHTRPKRRSAIQGRKTIQEALAPGGILDSQIDSQQWAENMGLVTPTKPSAPSASEAMKTDGESDEETDKPRMNIEEPGIGGIEANVHDNDAGVEAVPVPLDNLYDQTLRTIRVFLDRSQVIHHADHEQLRKAVVEAQAEAESLRKELMDTKAELQSLKNLTSSVVQKLSQGTANQ
ncbi:hypothetical protein GALMADRAFT_138892 [Galerina marginata CBS 339.88]|uniref:Uncharacterized protein n=1 Tax=Galerina marginata (strain CBS 339.88) TaxID=685588 RepID=A0A067T666_GALM3|nr:hypothetical protein GALMADRAFT_138892 [Galerina marginata CBS 339.88]